MTNTPLQNLKWPTLSKRGVAVLSIASTASIMLSVSALFRPQTPPPPPAQVIIVTVPAPQPAVMKVDRDQCPFLPGFTP